MSGVLQNLLRKQKNSRAQSDEAKVKAANPNADEAQVKAFAASQYVDHHRTSIRRVGEIGTMNYPSNTASEAGFLDLPLSSVASFLTFGERGRLLLVNKQLHDERPGIVRERTYGPSGISAVRATKLILCVVESEFGPTRLADSRTPTDAIAALTGQKQCDVDDLCYLLEKKASYLFSKHHQFYDLSKAKELKRCDDKTKRDLLHFLDSANELFFNLEEALVYLQSLKLAGSPAPDLYTYLVEDVGIPSAYLDRFAEVRSSQWGKAGADYDKEPLYYEVIGRDITVHNIDALFPANDTVRAVPSDLYNPKPLHFRNCIGCSTRSSEISNYECPYKWCDELHKGKCEECAPTSTCSSCGKKGCVCCFVPCKLCPNKMCNCSHFDGWKDSDRGSKPGCAYFVPSDRDDEDPEERYCAVCKPYGARKDELNVCVIM